MAASAHLQPLPATREVPAVSCDVKYQGFVYVNGGAGIVPGLDKVQEAVALLKKPKKARKAHPLFARGFDEMLTMRVSEQGIKVLIKADGGKNMVVMDHAIHKVAFVCNQGKSVLFIAKRRIDSTVDQFKCHGFEAASQATAKSLASHIVSTCNSVFRKLRRTRKQIRKRTEKEGKEPPMRDAKPAASAAAADEIARLKAALQAEVEAAKSYRMSLQLALSDLDDEDDDDEEEEQMTKDADTQMKINYEDFDDEFAKISLEITAAAEKAKASGKPQFLKLSDSSGSAELETVDVDELTESTADVNLDESEEFCVNNRSNSI